ncbi:MAG: vacuolar family H+-ATPase subunit H [bacterium]|nr:vacuolar family H+-ATPase subunit H [bacterium]
MSKIEQLIQEIEEYIDTCPFQPLSKSKIIVNKEELEELLVELRLRVPDEIKKYQKIISNQEAILAEAKKQAESMIDDATLKSNNILDDATNRSHQMIADAQAQQQDSVNNHEIMQQVYEQANQVMNEAQTRAQELLNQADSDAFNIRQGAMRYTDDMLRSLQNIITHMMQTSQQEFDDFIHAMHNNFEIAASNRNELAGGMNPSEGTEQTEESKKQ